MKKMKKILAMLLAFTMILGMTMTASAAEGDKKPEEGDKATATILGVEEGATITLYQIVDAQYNSLGLEKYVRANGLTEGDLADIYNPTHSEIELIAKKTLTAYSGVTWSYADGAYTASLDAGTYLVKVSGAGTTVYNPMIISIGYDALKNGNMNQLLPGSVDASDDWELNDVVAYAKSSDIILTKEIVGGKSPSVDDVAVDSTVNFKIHTEIPDYSGEYDTVVFTLYDNMDESLDLDATSINVIVTENKTEPVYTLTSEDHEFTVTFDSEWILENGEAKVDVTYSATLNENADTNFDPNTNTAKLVYTHKPGQTEDKEVLTRHYTFEIDGLINGTGSEVTEEIIKTGTRIVEGEEVTEPLAGATFEIRIKETQEVVGSAVSDDDGLLNFAGLDADVVYEIYEVSAPAGWSINDTVYEALITATYDAKGVLEKYNVAITNTGDNSVGNSLHTSSVRDGETEITDGSVTTEVPNTKLAALPSTGGIGTTIFTVAGCGIMIAAAFFFFASRKKENE